MNMHFRLSHILSRAAAALSVVFPLLLAGCSSDDALTYDRSVNQLYNMAMDAMGDEQYTRAAKLFEEVERQHPYSIWATRAQLMTGYANYEALNYDDAIDALTRFIELHPGNPRVDYAYYMRALCYYEQIADVRRDQKATEQAYEGFNEVMRRFPTSPYAYDARQKLSLTLDHLAATDMEVGRWYQGQGNMIAAINRFKEVVDRYQTTSHAAEALERLTEAYLTLGLREEAQRSAAVLGYNYPNTIWYKQAYGLLTPGAEIIRRPDQSLIDRIWDSMFN